MRVFVKWPNLLFLCVFYLTANERSITLLAAADSTSPTIHPVAINGAISKIYQKLPLVGKCCDVGEILTKSEDESKCIPINKTMPLEQFSPLFCEFNSSGVGVPGREHMEFVAIVGNPCPYKRYLLNPELTYEDEYYLLENGSLFLEHHHPALLDAGTGYCMDNILEFGLSALVCFNEGDVVSADVIMTSFACGFLISTPFLIGTIIAYTMTPRLRDAHGKALCNYCGCLTVTFITLAITQLNGVSKLDEICNSAVYIVQFSYVSSHFWLNVIFMENYLLVQRYERATRMPRIKQQRLYFYYSMWAWGIPILLIIGTLILDISPSVPLLYVKPNAEDRSCWFNYDRNAMVYLYLPISLLVLVNLILIVVTGFGISRIQNDLDIQRLARNRLSDREERHLFKQLKAVFFICLSLFILMFVNWLAEMITWWAGFHTLYWSAFDLINALHGVFIFVLFVLRKPVRNIVWSRIQEIRAVPAARPEQEDIKLYLFPTISNGE